MSTERPDGVGPDASGDGTDRRSDARARRGDRRRTTRWRRTLALTLGVLVVAAGALGAANAVRGPRLSEVEASASTLVDRAGARVVLRLDQPLAQTSAEGVAVEPAADVSATVDGAQLVLTFADPLAYATDYRVTVPAATGLYTGSQSRVTADFATADATLYTLVRDQYGDDEVRGVRLGDTATAETRVVAPNIQQFADGGAAIAVVVPSDGSSRAAGDDATLALSVGADQPLVPVPTGVTGGIRDLRGDAAAGLVGWITTPADGTPESLWTLDLQGSSGDPRQVTDETGVPMAVLDWRFVPGTTSVVVQRADLSFVLVDVLADTPPVPLGEYSQFVGVVPGTQTVHVADVARGALLDLATGDASDLDLLPPDVGDDVSRGVTLVLDPDGAYAQSFSIVDYAASRITGSFVTYGAAGETPTTVWQGPTDQTRIDQVCASPNGRVLVIATHAGEAGDGDPVVPGYVDATVVYLDLDTGQVLRTVAGIAPSWCA